MKAHFQCSKKHIIVQIYGIKVCTCTAGAKKTLLCVFNVSNTAPLLPASFLSTRSLVKYVELRQWKQHSNDGEYQIVSWSSWNFTLERRISDSKSAIAHYSNLISKKSASVKIRPGIIRQHILLVFENSLHELMRTSYRFYLSNKNGSGDDKTAGRMPGPCFSTPCRFAL